MSTNPEPTARFYKCGCSFGPDLETFCKKAYEQVWKEREAVQDRALDHATGEDAERAAYQQGYGRGWMNCHIGTQDARGEYEDVSLEELEPPDDGYDEDPRVVGYW